jgi:hypothetical protein
LLLLLCLHRLGVGFRIHILYGKGKKTRLDPHHLELNHLHLHLGLGHHVGSETRTEWHAVRVHAAGGLVMSEAIVVSIYGGSHRTIPGVEHILLEHLGDVVVFLLFWEEVGGVRG